jgi:hypothetical protein
MLCEWGIIGSSIVALAFVWTSSWFLRKIRRWTPATLVLLFAITLFIAHACFDFLNYSIPLLSLLAFIVAMTAKLTLQPEPNRPK